MTDKQNKLIPKLRFPEFKNDGEWESYAIEDLFEVRNGYTPSKSNPEFWEGGTIPWFRMEDIRQNGHILSDSIQHITPQAVKGTGLFPAYSIIVATTATIGEHALLIADSLANQRFTFLTKRKSLDDKLDMMFFHQYMFIVDEWCKRNTNFGGLLSVNMSAFKKLRVPVPSIQEQKRIADFLTSLDILLAGTKAKLEQLIDHKKGLMQKLFPAPGKTLPEYRFPGFVGEKEWEVKCLGDVTTIVNRRNKSRRMLPIYSINNKQGFILQSEQFNGLDSNSRGYDTSQYKIVNSNLFAYNPARINVGSIGYSGRIKEGIISSLYVCFKSTDTVTDDFLRCFFETDQFRRSVDNNVEGGIRSYLFYENFSRINIALPTIDEQKNIAFSILSINELIEQYENKVIVIENHRQGLMQQLFPKNE